MAVSRLTQIKRTEPNVSKTVDVDGLTRNAGGQRYLAALSWLGNQSHHAIELTQAESDCIAQFPERESTFAARSTIRDQGQPTTDLYILVSGWAATEITTSHGKRQIVRLHLPGDLMGIPCIGLSHAISSLYAITDVKVSVFSKRKLAQCFIDHPRLSMLYFVLAQHESLSLMERLTAMGQASAEQRLAYFLYSVLVRLRDDNPAIGSAFHLPLTQAEIGDVLGLTAVHVNRTLSLLERKKVILRQRQQYTILDEGALSAIADINTRTFDPLSLWFPTLSA